MKILKVIFSIVEPNRNSIWLTPKGDLKVFKSNGWESISSQALTINEIDDIFNRASGIYGDYSGYGIYGIGQFEE